MNWPPVHALLPAAGLSTRFGGELPKQYTQLAGKPVIAHSLAAVAAHPAVCSASVTLAADDTLFQNLVAADFPSVRCIEGGSSRALSVRNGLRAILEAEPAPPGQIPWVLVHDAARPCLTVQSLERLLEQGLVSEHGAILAMPLTDTIKQSSGRQIECTLDRELLWAAQTPQLFPAPLLLDCLESMLAAGATPTDEASALEFAGFSPLLVEGERSNLKITGVADLALAEYIMQNAHTGQNAQLDSSQ